MTYGSQVYRSCECYHEGKEPCARCFNLLLDESIGGEPELNDDTR